MPTTLLVPLDVAKRHCKDESSLTAGDVLLRVQYATDLIMDYLKSEANPGWLDGTVDVPPRLQWVALFVIANMSENRGDNNMAGNKDLWESIEFHLKRMRHPALA